GLVAFRLEFVFVADDEVDLRHVAKSARLGLGGAAGDDDAGVGVLAARLAHRLLGLAYRLGGDGAGIDDDGVVEPRLFRLGLHHRAFIGVEAAPERARLDGHQAASLRAQAPVAGSSRPRHSNWAGPVRVTWSSGCQATTRSPPGTVMVAWRAVRRVRAPLTSAAQAAEPQASVRPAPRSQVLRVTWSGCSTRAMEMLQRSGNSGWFSSSGPKRSSA